MSPLWSWILVGGTFLAAAALVVIWRPRPLTGAAAQIEADMLADGWSPEDARAIAVATADLERTGGAR